MERGKGLLSGNVLKSIGALAMLCDHVGLMFFPGVELFRIIGRLAFPIFAYMIAEGCRYTRSRPRYLLQMILLAFGCQVVYFLVDRSLYMSILVTFSCSILLICVLQHLKEAQGAWAALWGLAFVTAVAGVYMLNRVLEIDYGFWGCMAPVFPALFQDRRGAERKFFPKLDRREIHIGMFALGLVILWLDLGGDQLWSLLAIPVLLLYSGRRGSLPMKYFFYIFYPLHLALLQMIGWIIY